MTTTNRKISVRPDQQDVQRDLVRGLLPLGPFDQRDHPVEKAFAGFRRDPHHSQSDTTRGAPGDRRPVAAGLADHRGAFAGDGAFVDRGHAAHDLAIGRDQVARLDQQTNARAAGRRPGSGWQRQSRCQASSSTLGIAFGLGGAQRVGPRLAATFGQGFGKVGETARRATARRRCAARRPRPACPTTGRAGPARWSSPRQWR